MYTYIIIKVNQITKTKKYIAAPKRKDRYNMTTFVDIINRSTTITVDGYSNAKTLNGVMHDIAKIMKNICPNEVQTFMTKGKQDAIDLLCCTSEISEDGFFVEIKNVPCASKANENNEIEYKEGYNYYFCTRVVK